jgi:hypothetical protein
VLWYYQACEIAVHPSGRALFAANRHVGSTNAADPPWTPSASVPQTVACFGLGADGRLDAPARQLALPHMPEAVALSPRGDALFAVGSAPSGEGVLSACQLSPRSLTTPELAATVELGAASTPAAVHAVDLPPPSVPAALGGEFMRALGTALVGAAERVRAAVAGPILGLAEAAARRLLADGRLIVASNAPGFVSDAITKGAGLMMTKGYYATTLGYPSVRPTDTDVVVVSWCGPEAIHPHAPGSTALATSEMLADLRSTGALLVTIGPRLAGDADVAQLDSSAGRLAPALAAGFGAGVDFPIVSLTNLLMLWAFTGELSPKR